MNDLYDTKLCGSDTVYRHIDYSSQCWSKVFFHLPKFFVIIVSFCLHLYISQGSVKTQCKTHLPCGRIYNNHIIANCLQSVPVKNFFENWLKINKDTDTNTVPRFYGPCCSKFKYWS